MNTLKYFKALADETRLRIFHLLLYHEFSVNEIVNILAMGQSRISRHLKILTESGLLLHRRDGSFAYYHAVDNNKTRHLVLFIKQSLQKDSSFDFGQDLSLAEEILKQRKIKTKRFFNKVAQYWDELKQDILGDIDLNRIILDKMDKCGVAVDLGCGTGELLLLLSQKADLVIGVDSSPKMLAQAESRALRQNIELELRLGELEHLPLKDEEADLVVSNMVLNHLSEPLSGIQEAYRILKPGGIFIAADFAQHNLEMVREKYGGVWLGFARKDIENWLNAAGFSPDQMEQHDINYGLKINIYLANKKSG